MGGPLPQCEHLPFTFPYLELAVVLGLEGKPHAHAFEGSAVLQELDVLGKSLRADL